MTAYYNEIDPFAAAWLRELIKAGHIAPGEVDERSIADVMPSDLAGFTQCHFFAGIGVWSYALRNAGWSDDRQVWTGSCPCQPFSSAGKGMGFKDERHLWPEFYRLISECRPATCFGEQVASKDGLAWLDLVQADMEGTGYAFGAVDTCCASFGAPHIRQRLYWVAHSIGSGQQGKSWCRSTQEQRTAECGLPDGLAHAEHQGRDNWRLSDCRGNDNRYGGDAPQGRDGYFGRILIDSGADCNSSVRLEQPCADNRMAHTTGQQEHQEQQRPSAIESSRCADMPSGCRVADASQNPGPTNGFWRDVDWLLCRDGKWRPTQSIIVEMADGLADRLGYSRFGDRWSLNPLIQKAENRVGRLKGYGNAINAEQAKAFIEAFMEVN